MAADGSIVIETDIKTEKARNKLEKLNNDMARQAQKIEALNKKHEQLMSGAADDGLLRQIEETGNAYSRQTLKIEALEAKREKLYKKGDTQGEAVVRANLEKEYLALDKIESKLEALEQKRDYEASAEEIEKSRLELERAELALGRMQTEADGLKQQLAISASGGEGMQNSLNGAVQATQKLEKRIATIAKKVFVFTVISAALRSLKSYFSDVLKSNEDFQQSLAMLKGALLTAAQLLSNVLIPALKALVNVLALAANYLTRFMALISGKSIKSATDAAKATYELAKATEELGSAAAEAQRQMSGLDEMNTWQSSSSSSSGGSGTSDADFDFADKVADKMGWLEGVISIALLAVGAVLLFSGASIPFGLALMVFGAMGLVSAVAENWDAAKMKLEKSLSNILSIGGALLLGVGAVLTFSGAHLPLGIALLIAGAFMLVSAVALNWGNIKEILQGQFGEIMELVATGMIVLGLLLTLSGVNIPLGLALIATGAVALVTAIAANWDSIVKQVKQTWKSIKDFWNQNIAPIFTRKWWANLGKKCINGLISIVESGINGMIEGFEDMINWIVKQLNKLSFDLPDSLGGATIGFDLDKVKFGRVEIPRLAQGAVIPANREFLAVLGDQKSGRNLEAPEELIRKIVREESGSSGTITFIAQLDGKTIFKKVVEQAKIARRMTGENPMLLGD